MVSSPLIKDFFEFVYDRQLVWHRKEVLKQPAPWTDYPLLAKYHFCNVYRELDKGTKYLIDVINNAGLSKQDLFLNIVAYRIFNRVGTFEKVFDGYLHCDAFDPKVYERLLDEKKKSLTLFSNAYLINQTPFQGGSYRVQDKHVQIILLLDWLSSNIDKFIAEFEAAPTAEDKLTHIRTISKVGPFLGFQIFMDLFYAGFHPHNENEYCVMGPGAKTGVEFLLSGRTNDKAALSFSKELWESQSDHFDMLLKEKGKDWWEIAYATPYNPGKECLSWCNIEFSLCEFRKYSNLKKALTDPSIHMKRRYYKGSPA